jgi:hypothetical protein
MKLLCYGTLTICDDAFKGPKLEIFGSRVCAQIRLVWVSDLGTRPKNAKF